MADVGDTGSREPLLVRWPILFRPGEAIRVTIKAPPISCGWCGLEVADRRVFLGDPVRTDEEGEWREVICGACAGSKREGL